MLFLFLKFVDINFNNNAPSSTTKNGALVRNKMIERKKNVIQNITQKTKDRATRTQLKYFSFVYSF